MGAILGFDANSTKTSQTTVQQQATSQYGAVTGGTAEQSIGSKGAGIGARSKVSAAKGGSVGISIVNTTLDEDLAQSALASNAQVTVAALKSQQDLSTLAVGYAQQNATNALLTLQNLGQGQQVVAAGGTAQDVLQSATGSNVAPPTVVTKRNVITAIVVIVIAVVGYAIIKRKL